MKNLKKILALVLAMVMVFCLAACGEEKEKEEENTTPLVVGYSNFSEKFSPFFADTAYDQDAVGMVSIGLLASDRTGAILFNAGTKAGETVAYNGTDYTYYAAASCKVTENADGTVYYDFTLRDDITFSDGTKLTADDVIFTMYVLSDPTYDGSSTFWNLPIDGMEDYRAGMEILYNMLLEAGKDNTDFTYWTKETQDKFWNEGLKEAGAGFAGDIVSYVVSNYASSYASYLEACNNNEVAFGMMMWGFGSPTDDGKFKGASGTVYEYADLSNEVYWDEIYQAYDGDVATASSTEAANAEIYSFFASEWAVGVTTGASVDYIKGIQKTGDYTFRVVLTEVSAVAQYQLALTIAPLHYYGSTDKYDYDNHKFGFAKGDLSSVKAVTTKPLGAGPYKFIKYEDGIIYYEANETYFLGTPKTKYVQFKEGTDADKLSGVTSGTIDISDPSFSTTVIKAIKEANGNDELTGSKVTTSLVDNLGYGYIGICADTMNIGGKENKDSDASKALRKAFATIYSVYRDVSIDTYYGDRAAVINYPISNTSWAAPQSTDEGYEIAYSKDADGNALYTADMTAEQKYAAALAGAKSWFLAAGYTEKDGKLVAPAGGRTEFEVWIPADGTGDHPAFMILEEASKALETIGITLKVKDLANSSDLWTALDAVTVDMWAAAWGSTVDPDMTQVYHSSNASGSNHYHIADAKLDEYMAEALKTTDTATRKTLYKACLDIILDWGVEVPTYQRKNAVIFSTERVNIDTVAKDITPFYGWLSEVDKIELK